MNQIKKRKQVYPNHIDQVPIKPDQIDRREISAAKASADRPDEYPDR